MNPTLEELQKAFVSAGATKVLLKVLAENDNSKQQIYLGKGFGALNEIPFGEITTHTDCKEPNFKAHVHWSWLSPDGRFVRAPHAQLILYPGYPEVRLSGFLLGCAAGPSKWMQPIPKDQRKGRDVPDGRVLFIAVTSQGKVLAHLAPPGSMAAHEVFKRIDEDDLKISRNSGVFYRLLDALASDDSHREALLQRLREIHSKKWIAGKRLLADGTVVSYKATNGGGYTLEAELGIKPNGLAAPDFQGWEIKASADNRVTLMTPEPDGGYYGKNGVESFVRKYGYLRPDGAWYFTGLHRVGERHIKTKQILTLKGFDSGTGKILNLDGGILLLDSTGEEAAGWTYARLIEHWGRKHANAAYVSCDKNAANEYRYLSPVQLGTGTSFEKFLCAMQKGLIVYDPAPKISPANEIHGSRVKARSQFRTSKKSLSSLYDLFECVDL